MDTLRLRQAGIQNHLNKPVKRSHLREALLTALGVSGGVVAAPGPAPGTSPLFRDARVLLAEDHPINQRVATEILESAGIAVHTAVNGQEALNALRRSRFDLVLMDIQMPVLDGFEATRRLRQELDLKDLPVIAMTAHAMSGDRDKCLRAGMNDYLSKPIGREELFTVLRRYLRVRKPVAPERLDGPPPAVMAVAERLPELDVREGVARIGGAWDLYLEILESYCDAHRDFEARFSQMTARGDFTAARTAAHALKGAAGNVSAVRLFAVADELEQACAQQDIPRISQSLKRVARALQVLLEGFATLKAACGPAQDAPETNR
jgi:CheY-like chemotaxis protein